MRRLSQSHGCTHNFAPLVATIAAVIALGTCGLAPAQVSRGGGSSGANTQLMMQLQQAQTERSQLQAENSKLKKLLAESELDKAALKDLLGRKW